ncbi:Mu DNA-binding protein [Hephaestia caeni]|uniref:Mu DNA-binding protein n=1 Tax=Hephaestia caeni TaxID=645617 RepID=A0A397P700_9SPHN|nr:transposase domain-containing protein [Hephaestia caeni]RIA44073.1 Mu DNA-binding protein [Hephaestia caeni]
MKPFGGKVWFTSAELAALKLPGLPKSKRRINERADDEGWALRQTASGEPLARPRQARGGGLEYHVEVLPSASRIELARRGIAVVAIVTDRPPARPARASGWDWFDRQPEKVKAEARRRAEIVDAVAAHERLGFSRSTAVASAAGEHGGAASTLWGWLKSLNGTDPADRLVHLAPRRAGGGTEAEIDPRVWQHLKSNYLRPEKPTFSSCYRWAEEYAETIGATLPCERSLRRKFDREVDRRVIVAARKGKDALRETMPPQQRTVADLHALELINMDGHKWDVFVRFPDGAIRRPMMVAIQDVYSRKFLSWRIGVSESALMTRLALADMLKKFGIPKGAVVDNGRGFASKWITGGSPTRFRFKIKDDEPLGLLTALNITTHWTTPYRGSSKPIERGFGDFCRDLAKHPAFAGAYTGNRPDAKPENYASKAIDLDVFVRVIARGIAAHNARQGRRTEIAAGRSFDDAFNASYAVAPIGKATEEQLRLALMAGEQLSTDRKSGHIRLHGNRYWAPELSQIAGQKVTIRFDPDDLMLPVHVYDRAGRFLVSAGIIAADGFLDVEAARRRARQEADWRKATRRATELEDLLSADQIAALLPDYADESDPPAPAVVRPVRHRGQTAAALKPVSEPASAPAQSAFMDKFSTAVSHLRLVE